MNDGTSGRLARVDHETTRVRPGASLIAFGCGSPLLLYGVGYFYLRLTHALINYGHFIAGPNFFDRRIPTLVEFFYLPLITLEELVRGL